MIIFIDRYWLARVRPYRPKKSNCSKISYMWKCQKTRIILVKEFFNSIYHLLKIIHFAKSINLKMLKRTQQKKQEKEFKGADIYSRGTGSGQQATKQ
jgi:hypothetical protein